MYLALAAVVSTAMILFLGNFTHIGWQNAFALVLIPCFSCGTLFSACMAWCSTKHEKDMEEWRRKRAKAKDEQRQAKLAAD